MVILAPDGDYARFENRGGDEKKLDFMLIEAEPTGENIAVQVRVPQANIVGSWIRVTAIFNSSFLGPFSY